MNLLHLKFVKDFIKIINGINATRENENNF